MEGAATHTSQDISNATTEAFVDRESAARPVIKNTLAEKGATTEPVPATPPAPVVAAAPKEGEAAAAEPAATTAAPVELSDEAFEKELARRSGGKIKSLSELNTPPAKKSKEEIEEEERVERNNELEWAISSGELSRTDYETALGEKGKSNRDLALAVFTAEMLEIDPKLESQDIDELFKDYYMEEGDDADPKRKLRLKEMNALADAERTKKSGILDQITPKYKSHRQREANRTAIKEKVDAVFEKAEDKISIKSVYEGVEGKSADIDISYVIDAADVKAIKSSVRKNMFEILDQLGVGADQITEKDVEAELQGALRGRLFDKIVAHVAAESAKKGRMDAEAFYKNIPVRQPNFTSTNTGNRSTAKTREFSDAERAAFPGK